MSQAVRVHMLCSTTRLLLTQRFSVCVGTLTLKHVACGKSGHRLEGLATHTIPPAIELTIVVVEPVRSNGASLGAFFIIVAHVFMSAKWRPDCLCHLIVFW
jgi:hypothetical protein